ncbi:MAG: ShlB/FhaC/HecB family hemolysin secretion/activation protein [Pseudomonadota bacterium]
MRLKSIPALLCALSAGHAWSQSVPDAGQTMRELQRPAVPAPAKEAPRIAVTPERPAMSTPDGAKIPVKSFQVTGAQRFAAADLGTLLAPWAGRELSMPELREAAARITRHYREAGYLVARAYVPAQTMRDGVVEIAVLEGRLGKIELKNGSRVADGQARALLGNIRSGDPVVGPTLEHSLGLLNQTPGVGRAGAVLQPGSGVGLSDLVVALEPGPLVSGAIDADNHGNRYTGNARLGATVHVNSPLGLGDQFSMRYVHSDDDLQYGRLAYRAPIGADGLVLGASIASSRYRLGEDFAPLDVNGDALTTSVFASYPFLRSAALNLTGSVSADGKKLQDRVAAVQLVTDKSVKSFTAGVAGHGRSGATEYSFSAGYTRGDLDIESAAVLAADAATARTQGKYGKLAYFGSGTMALSGPWSAYVGINGQIASKNLDSSEKFSLGGPDGVRAYPQGEAPSDQGYLGTAEIRYALPATGLGAMRVAAFIDHGHARVNRNPFVPGVNSRKLSGAGVGLNWYGPWNTALNASLAWKLGDAKPTSDKDRSARAWLQVTKYF